MSVLNIFNVIYPYNNNISTQNLFETVAYRLVTLILDAYDTIKNM